MKRLHLNPNLAEIDITDPSFATFVIENKKFFWRLGQYMYLGFPEHQGYLSVDVDGSFQDLDKMSLYVYNPSDLNLNTKQNLNALYKILKKTYSEQLLATVDEIEEQLTAICEEIKLDFDAELTMDESVRIDDIFKIGNLRFADDDLDFLGKLTKLVIATYELRGSTLVFINHLHDYLETAEIETFMKDLAYRGISIVNIETSEPQNRCENEQISIVDSDLCAIGS
jgi:CRISPR type II-A-associated protein Csn2